MSYFTKETYEADEEATKSLYWSWFFVSLFTLSFILFGCHFISKLSLVSKFNEVSGKVLSSQVVEYRGSKGSIHHRAEIVYEYYIDKETYQSNKYDMFNMSKNYLNPRETVEDYNIGKNITVYVNPYNKYETVLDKKIHPYYFSLVPFFFLILLVWLIYYQMYKTGNYYLLNSSIRRRRMLVLAYPDAVVFALCVTMITSVLCGFLAEIKNTNTHWSFFIIWIILLGLTFIISYQYKKFNLTFSKRFENIILESEKYNN